MNKINLSSPLSLRITVKLNKKHAFLLNKENFLLWLHFGFSFFSIRIRCKQTFIRAAAMDALFFGREARARYASSTELQSTGFIVFACQLLSSAYTHAHVKISQSQLIPAHFFIFVYGKCASLASTNCYIYTHCTVYTWKVIFPEPRGATYIYYTTRRTSFLHNTFPLNCKNRRVHKSFIFPAPSLYLYNMYVNISMTRNHPQLTRSNYAE